MREAFIRDYARTPIGRFGGTLLGIGQDVAIAVERA